MVEKGLGPFVAAGKREQAAQVVVSILEESFAGPIAHPRHLEEYERIAPGASDRIIKMAEKAQDHNISMESLGVNAAISDEKRGMWMGAGILVLLVVTAFLAGAVYNNNVCAGLLLGAAVLNVIALFLNRNRK